MSRKMTPEKYEELKRKRESEKLSRPKDFNFAKEEERSLYFQSLRDSANF